MQEELTLGEIYDAIAEKLAEARTMAIMGERQQALGVLHGAALEMTRFRDVLRDVPGYLALDHAFETTMRSLCAEQDAAETESDKTAETKKTETKKRERKIALQTAQGARRRLEKAA